MLFLTALLLAQTGTNSVPAAEKPTFQAATDVPDVVVASGKGEGKGGSRRFMTKGEQRGTNYRQA